MPALNSIGTITSGKPKTGSLVRQTPLHCTILLTTRLVISRVIGKINPDSLRRWFKAQVPVMQSFQHPLPGRPRAEDRPLYCWWFLMQGYS